MIDWSNMAWAVVGRRAVLHHQVGEDGPADHDHAERDDRHGQARSSARPPGRSGRRRHGTSPARARPPARSLGGSSDPGHGPGPRRFGARRRRSSRRAVADAADGGDVARLGCRVVELVPEPADVDIDRPLEDAIGVVAVDAVEELVAGQDPAVGLEERDQQPELDGRQGDVPPGDRRPSAGRDRRPGRRGPAAGRLGPRPSRPGCSGRLDPGQDPPDPEDELGRRERLGQVVVGPGRQAADPVGGRAPSREDDDRRVVGRARSSRGRRTGRRPPGASGRARPGRVVRARPRVSAARPSVAPMTR